jgi:hypothetical protein
MHARQQTHAVADLEIAETNHALRNKHVQLQTKHERKVKQRSKEMGQLRYSQIQHERANPIPKLYLRVVGVRGRAVARLKFENGQRFNLLLEQTLADSGFGWRCALLR